MLQSFDHQAKVQHKLFFEHSWNRTRYWNESINFFPKFYFPDFSIYVVLTLNKMYRIYKKMPNPYIGIICPTRPLPLPPVLPLPPPPALALATASVRWDLGKWGTARPSGVPWECILGGKRLSFPAKKHTMIISLPLPSNPLHIA